MSENERIEGIRLFDCLLCEHGKVKGKTKENIKISCSFSRPSILFITEYNAEKDFFEIRCLKFNGKHYRRYEKGKVNTEIPNRTPLFSLKEVAKRMGLSYNRLATLYKFNILPEPDYSIESKVDARRKRFFRQDEVENLIQFYVSLKGNKNINKLIREFKYEEKIKKEKLAKEQWNRK